MASTIQNNSLVSALKERARTQGIPLYGAFELTGRCNLNCKMCYVHVMDQKDALKRELSTEKWKEIMDEAYASGMLFALLTGGECMLRPDFKELYLHLYHKGVIMSVNTNGIFIDENMACFLEKHRPEWVQISLYGSNDEGYEKVTGSRQFSRVVNAIELLRERGITVKVAVTPSRYMTEDFGNIMKFILEKKLTYRINDALIPPRNEIQRDDYTLTADERIQLLKEKSILCGKELSEKCPGTAPMPCGNCTDEIYGMPCNAGTIRFVAGWDGKMYPCMAIPEIYVDILAEGFMSSWNKIKGIMAKVKRPVECSGCIYEKICSYCPAIRYDGLFSGHCRKEICEFSQMKYEAGVIKL